MAIFKRAFLASVYFVLRSIFRMVKGHDDDADVVEW